MDLTLCTNKTCKIRNKCFRSQEDDDNWQSWAEFGGEPCQMFIQRHVRVWYCDKCNIKIDNPMAFPCVCGSGMYTSKVEEVNE